MQKHTLAAGVAKLHRGLQDARRKAVRRKHVPAAILKTRALVADANAMEQVAFDEAKRWLDEWDETAIPRLYWFYSADAAGPPNSLGRCDPE